MKAHQYLLTAFSFFARVLMPASQVFSPGQILSLPFVRMKNILIFISGWFMAYISQENLKSAIVDLLSLSLALHIHPFISIHSDNDTIRCEVIHFLVGIPGITREYINISDFDQSANIQIYFLQALQFLHR
jgi:hypothetical protein